jgi:hypothetical protein
MLWIAWHTCSMVGTCAVRVLAIRVSFVDELNYSAFAQEMRDGATCRGMAAKAIRDRARDDTERAEGSIGRLGPTITFCQDGPQTAATHAASNGRINCLFALHSPVARHYWHDSPERRADDYSAAIAYHSKPPMIFSPLRWEIVSAIGYLRKIDPITPLPLLLGTMRRMASACAEAGAIPVVLSPFVYASRYTMRHAIAYTSALRDLAEAQHMIFVDSVALLRPQPKSLILQYDGFHLTPLGHELVAKQSRNR